MALTKGFVRPSSPTGGLKETQMNELIIAVAYIVIAFHYLSMVI